MLAAVADEAARRGYRVIELGASLHGDVQEIVDSDGRERPIRIPDRRALSAWSAWAR